MLRPVRLVRQSRARPRSGARSRAARCRTAGPTCAGVRCWERNWERKRIRRGTSGNRGCGDRSCRRCIRIRNAGQRTHWIVVRPLPAGGRI